MSMAAGDFAAVYGDPRESGAWDAVVTCFFIDTRAQRRRVFGVRRQLSSTRRRLGEFRPLLYHWEEHAHEMSVELSLDEVLIAAESFGLDSTNANRVGGLHERPAAPCIEPPTRANASSPSSARRERPPNVARVIHHHLVAARTFHDTVTSRPSRRVSSSASRTARPHTQPRVSARRSRGALASCRARRRNHRVHRVILGPPVRHRARPSRESPRTGTRTMTLVLPVP